MSIRNKHIPFAFIALLLLVLHGFAQQLPVRPSPPRLVNDLAGVLSDYQLQQLEDTLVEFNNKTSNQITIVIVSSLDGYDKADYAIRIGHEWGVGQQKFDNGVVVLVKPRYGNERGEAFIAVGYGLEPVITDAACRRIIEKEMIPHFAEDDYYSGINAGIKVLMGLAAKEFSSEDYAPQVSPLVVFIPFLLFIILIILLKRRSMRHHNIGDDMSLWNLLHLLSRMEDNTGKFDDFRTGKGSFGGSLGSGGRSSGGFGGFGGGSFGGGGAGGSW